MNDNRLFPDTFSGVGYAGTPTTGIGPAFRPGQVHEIADTILGGPSAPYRAPRLAPGLQKVRVGNEEVIIQLDERDMEAMLHKIFETATALAVARKLEGETNAEPDYSAPQGLVVKSFVPMRPNPLKRFVDSRS